MPGLDTSTAGLVFLGIAEVPQIMSAFLPSPTTAYMGGADPTRVAWLRRGEIMGSAVSMTLALGITLIARKQAGNAAWGIFAGSATVLGLFLAEYERAIRLGQQAGPTPQGNGY
jgi:hypothetical protein